MRVTAAVIGGLGAALGAFQGFILVLATVLLALSGDDSGFNPLGARGPAPGFNPFLILWGGTEGGAAISCILGMVGVGFAIANRPRTGAWLMLAGAVGVAASRAAYSLLLPLAMAPAPPELVVYPRTGYYIVSLAPALALLVGAALAFLARRRSGSQPASC